MISFSRAWKFVAAGGLVMVLSIVLMYLFTDIVGFYYVASAVLVLLISLTINYFINNAWAFNDRKNKSHAFGWTKFLMVTGICEALYFVLLIGFTDGLGIYYLLSVVMAVLIRFPVKYLLCCWLVFPDKDLAR